MRDATNLDFLPTHLRTEDNARFLEQVQLDLEEAGVPITEETVTEAMVDRLRRNLAISQNNEVEDLLRALVYDTAQEGDS